MLSVAGNPLYHGKHCFQGRYLSYGQHSFVADLFAGLARTKAQPTLYLDDPAAFPLGELVGRVGEILPSPRGDWSALEGQDLVVGDGTSAEIVPQLPPSPLFFEIVHNSRRPPPPAVVERADRIICLSEVAESRLANFVPCQKLAMVHQGVDLEKFPVVAPQPWDRPTVLLHCRLDGSRGALMVELVDSLDRVNYEVIVVGDGRHFWEIADRFGREILLINFVPYPAIQRLYRRTSLVVSSGRGAMEALASGIPTICAGYGYGGPVDESNFAELLRGNLTGRGLPATVDNASSDVAEMLNDPRRSRWLGARPYLSVDRFVKDLLSLA